MELTLQCSRCGRSTLQTVDTDGACSAICADCIEDQVEAARAEAQTKSRSQPGATHKTLKKASRDK